MPKEEISTISTFAANFILMLIIVTFIVLALIKKIVYDAFIEGAKEGFNIAIKIIPFLVAILVAIGIFRGAMDFIISGIAMFFSWLGIDTQFTSALPVAFMKPLSGSGARGLMIDAMTTHGAIHLLAGLPAQCRVQLILLFILLLYISDVDCGIKNTRHAIGCGLLADLAGFTTAIFVAYLFFT